MAPAPQVKPHAKTPRATSVSPALRDKVGGGGLCQRMFSNIVNPNVRSFKVTENLCKNERTQIMKSAEKKGRTARRRKEIVFVCPLLQGPTLVLQTEPGRQDYSKSQSVLSLSKILCNRLTQPGGINLSPRDRLLHRFHNKTIEIKQKFRW